MYTISVYLARLTELQQNNGRLAHQEVGHVHFHVIPKPDEKQGLVVGWPQQKFETEDMQKLHDELLAKL